MEEYYKKNNSILKDNSEDIQLHIIEWWHQDEKIETDESDNEEECMYCGKEPNNKYGCKCNLEEYIIRCFGVSEKGESFTCKITNFKPYFYIKVSNNINNKNYMKIINYVESAQNLKMFPNLLAKKSGKHLSKLVQKKDLFGFTNGKYYNYIKLVFNNNVALRKCKYLFKKPINIQGITEAPTKFKLYESNIDGFMRYAHIKDILMGGWIKLPKELYTITSNSDVTTNYEVTIDCKNVESLKEKKEIAPFLQVSWDIETYSHDYSFPDPDPKKNKKNIENVIYQIASTFKIYGQEKMLVKHLLTLKNCEPIEGAIVEECKTERELIKKWIDIISKMDPDIMYTYNGDTFDCRYLFERAKIYNLENYLLKNLSRIESIPSTKKEEIFSSGAYGDSEYTRFYIPGRLNYDLLTHYKRGMKKYPSYKLDYIASEILKEGKHPVSAKDIFQYYEIGTPEKISHIARYCIQDTELLQRLVDKQLILPNIMQLANVTFVPIGYLNTRGQTIKVFSQLLRKARQMDFLVPHTNFNENDYPLLLKMKDNIENVITQDDINNYIQLELGNSCIHNIKKCEVCSKKTYNTSISCKIVNVIDNTILVNSDTEIFTELFNRTFLYKYKKYTISKIIPNNDAVDDSFSGATVLDGKNGLHRDNVAILDFASLYPTIMISRNLCYSTFVMNPKFLGIDNVKYENIAWDDRIEYKMKHTCDAIGKSGKSKGNICGKQAFFEIDDEELGKVYRCRIHDLLKKTRPENEKYQKRDVRFDFNIVQPSLDENGNVINKGVLPALLEELYDERKKVKRQMNVALQENNKLLAEILDATQLAIKVSLNSTYGFLGRCQGNLILKELGSIVTSVGRTLIEQSKNYAETTFSNYIRENNLITYTLKEKDISTISEEDKELLLEKFKQ